jgi:Tfp pilus assembly protein FimT
MSVNVLLRPVSRVTRRAPASKVASVSGFSLIDILATVAILGVAMAIAVPQVGTALIDARADAGMRQVVGHLRSARDTAMTQRRTIEVQFIGTNQMQSIRINGNVRTTIARTILENGIQFALSTGVPDSPDAFGNARAVDFGGPTTAWFLSDGSFVDAANLPLSGSVFLAMPNRPLSARAVTVLGPTGRVQSYKWNSRVWR